MGRNTSYFPSTDKELLLFSKNFSTRISAQPEVFGLSELLTEGYAELHQAFADAINGVEPGARCKVNVSRKNDARERLKLHARLLVSIINGQADVSDAQKLELGLTVAAPRTRRSAPAGAPVVQIVSTIGHTVSVRLHDADNYVKRARPRDADGALIFTCISDQLPVDSSPFKYEMSVPRTGFQLNFPHVLAPGQKVWVAARWTNARGDGPMSRPVSAHIQFGGPLSLAA